MASCDSDDIFGPSCRTPLPTSPLAHLSALPIPGIDVYKQHPFHKSHFMSHLYPLLRLHQIFGANTDVGKTIFTTALCLASSQLPVISGRDGSPGADALLDTQEKAISEAMAGASSKGETVHYLKPVSTGPIEDSDDNHLSSYASPASKTTLLRFADPVSPHLAARLSPPSLSPLADSGRVPSDAELVRSIGDWIANKAKESSGASVAYIETAGGPHSPSPNGSSQLHLLRPLRLPTILIGDSNLGGISTTRSAYESLLIAGHQVDAILLFSQGREDRWGNADYLTNWGKEINLPVWGLAGLQDATNSLWGGPPPRAGSQQEETKNMQDYYRGLVFGRRRIEGNPEEMGGVIDVVRELRLRHHYRLRELETLASRTRESCWWPFTQHSLAKKDSDVTVIDSAYGDFWSTFKQQRQSVPQSHQESRLQPMLDGSASWWTQCVGHAHPALAQAAARAAGRYGHVLFPMAANAPALRLAETLLGRSKRSLLDSEEENFSPSPGQGWADRVFFSDNGATGMEVALKMAIASSRAHYDPPAVNPKTEARVLQGRKAGTSSGRPHREWKILGLKGSYHGDTMGVMDACEPSVYSDKVDWYRGKGAWLDPPSVGIVEGKATVTMPTEGGLSGQDEESFQYGSLHEIYDLPRRLIYDSLTHRYREHIRSWLDALIREQGHRFGALVIEPIVLGAGGMIFVDPLFQRCLVDIVRESEDLFALSDPPMRDGKIRPIAAEREGSWKGLPIIFDEVFTGLFRLGHSTPATLLGTHPDISCLAKILTGGLLPLSVTLASASIFQTFTEGTEKKVDALLHGHSYTAHPVGCEVAREALRLIGGMEKQGCWDVAKQDWRHRPEPEVPRTLDQHFPPVQAPEIWSLWSKEAVEALSRSRAVQSAMAMGTVLVLHLKDEKDAGYSSTASVTLLEKLRLSPAMQQGHPSVPSPVLEGSGVQLPFNIHARPLGNVVYFMCSLNTPEEVRRETEKMVRQMLEAA